MFAMVVGFAGAGAIVLGNELGGDENSDRVPTAWEVAFDFLAAVDDRKVGAAAKLTDAPGPAESTLKKVFAELPDAKLATVLGEVKEDGDAATSEFNVRWGFDTGRSLAYLNTIKLVKRDDRWAVHWTPALVHPDLGPGQHLAVVTRTDAPAVVDAAGKPLMTWQDGSPRPTKEDRARLVQPGMLTLAQKRGAPDDWAVAAIDGKGKRVRILAGDGPSQAAPVRSTLSLQVQDAAQSAVDSVKRPAALVAIRPSTGGILAIAQNEAASVGPIALSGLFPPGSTFKIVTAAAALEDGSHTAESTVPCPGRATFGARTMVNKDGFDLGDVPLRTAFAKSCNTSFGYLAEDLSSGALVSAADQLGLNADFDITGISTEAGAVRKAADDAQRIEDAIGQGQVHLSPFGVALMSATVAAGEPVTPQLWADRKTKVIKGYDAPSEATIAALRTMMRETVTSGTATALREYGAVHGKTGTAQAGGGAEHGWFAGFRDDLAFAILVENGGSAQPALAVTKDFLDAL